MKYEQLQKQMEIDPHLLSAIVESSTDAIFAKDRRGIYLWINTAGAMSMGWTVPEVVGKSDSELLPPEVAKRIQEIDRRVMETGEPITIEEALVVRGEMTTFCSSKVPYRDADGKVIGVIGVARDITERKKAEEVVRNSQAELESRVGERTAELRTSETALRQSNERLQFLSATAAELLQHDDPLRLLKAIYDRLSALLGLDTYFHFALESERGPLRLAAYSGVSAETAKKIEWLEFGQAVCGTVAQLRKPILAENVQRSTDPMMGLIRKLGISAYVCHPLLWGNQLLGTLSFGSRRSSTFDAETVAFVRAVSDMVATALARWRIQEALRSSDERYRLAVHGAQEWLWELNLEMNEVVISPEAKQVWGETDLGMVPSKEGVKSVHVDNREQVRKALDAHLSGKTPYCEIRVLLQREDGEWRWVRVRGIAIRDASGKPVRLAGTFTDMTERRTVFQEQVLEPLHEIAAATGEGEPLSELPRRVYSHEDELRVVGDYLRALMSHVKETRASLERSRQDLLRSAEKLARSEQDLAQSRSDLELSMSELARKEQDLSESRRALDEKQLLLKTSEELAAVGRLAASVAHEIRNPLTAIQVRLFSLEQAARNDPQLEKDCHVIAEEIERLEGIVNDFLEFARPRELKLRECDMLALGKTTTDLLQHRLDEKSISVLSEDNSVQRVLKVDPDQMKQVFLNLLKNAIDAVDDGGEIRISLDTEIGNEGESLMVRVQDTGCGIPEEVQKRLFDPFFTTKENGTGLGLCICAQIMDRHGGRLLLEETSENGTTFAFKLPC